MLLRRCAIAVAAVRRGLRLGVGLGALGVGGLLSLGLWWDMGGLRSRPGVLWLALAGLAGWMMWVGLRAVARSLLTRQPGS